MFSVSYQFLSSWCERHGAPEFFQTEASSWGWGPRARRFPDWPSWRKCRSRDRPTWEASGPGSNAAEARRRWRPSWRARRPTKPPGPGGGGSRPERAKAAAERSRDSNPRAWDQQPCRSDAPIRWFAFVREIREIRKQGPTNNNDTNNEEFLFGYFVFQISQLSQKQTEAELMLGRSNRLL